MTQPAAAALAPAAGATRAALLAIVALALGLRAWRVGHGLPDFLDEAIPLRRALEMCDGSTGRIDWNPHLFHYPSLTFYLHVMLQQLVYWVGHVAGSYANHADYALATTADAAALAIPGRLMSAAFDAWTVWSVGLIGERLRPRAGLLAASITALSPTLVASARLVYSDTMMTAFLAASLERLFAWRRQGGARRLALAVLWLGLAIGSKYPAAAILVVFTAAVFARLGRRGLPVALLAAAGAAAVFTLTTPYMVLDWPRFSADVEFVAGLAREGHLGNLERAGLPFYVRLLARDAGWAALAALAASLPLLARRGRARTEPALLWLSLLLLGAPIAVGRVEAERYLIALVPPVSLLAAWATVGITDLAAHARPAAAAIAAAVLLAQPLWAGARAGAAVEDATRSEARAWCEAHLESRDVVVQEAYGAPLLEQWQADVVHASDVYAGAGAGARRAYDARRVFHGVQLPLRVAGNPAIHLVLADGRAVDVRTAAHDADLNNGVYDPRLFAGVDVIVTTSAVRGRFEADSARFAAPCRLYRLLDSTATVLARFAPRGSRRGPAITIYRTTERTQAAIDALGPLPPLWWTSAIEAAYRGRVEAYVLPPERRGREPDLTAEDEPATWIRSLRPLAESWLGYFPLRLCAELSERGQHAAAAALARSVLVLNPGNPAACLVCVRSARRLGDWTGMRARIDRTLSALPAADPLGPELRKAREDALARDADRERTPLRR